VQNSEFEAEIAASSRGWRLARRLRRFLERILTPSYKGFEFEKACVCALSRDPRIIKCVAAYFLASLFSFNYTLGSIILKADAKHLVGTIVVYFHPARSCGSMTEATLFALLGISFAAFASTVNMATVFACDHWFGRMRLGYLIALLFWCTITSSIVALAKFRMNKPTFNTACSLAALVYFR